MSTQSATRLRGRLHNWKEKCKTQEGEKCLFWRGLSLASEVSDHVLLQSPGLETGFQGNETTQMQITKEKKNHQWFLRKRTEPC